ncbi:carboxyl transferase domain-containing protein [Paraburkholderia sp. BL10I2N1]|uniref:acyl-CoA carboxylase subunit beta n=1 Tax=Paraburkholderia sp. BL10I2N1 TaxID=1938796 RepID=UPI0010D02A68|nr:carboxyl transferase domain-containing protein [Paraburkholderia sp. BL10I2N1]TDN59135.1 acetyl-CoA carboxylase carboxyltransferase component [Paraburkholderia sp. BL10I2N1]
MIFISNMETIHPGYEAQIAELQLRRQRTLEMGGAAKLERRRASGLLNARERIDALLDAGSFREIGMLALPAQVKDQGSAPADGKLTGFGKIEAQRVAVVSNDLTVKGASSATINIRKIAYMKEAATRNGMPLIFLGESTGSRVPDTMGAQAMAQGGQDAQQYCRRRETPWVSAVLGPCLGSSTWYSCVSDFVVMRKGAFLAVSSPRVTSVAIDEQIDPEELGGWRLHAEQTGLIDMVVDSDEAALLAIRRFLGYLPSHSGERPLRYEANADSAPDASKLLELVPVERSKTYDMRKVIAAIVDRDSFFPLKDRFGRAAVTGLARLDGETVGIVASNPFFKAGAMDPDACRKVTSFLVLCDSFNIPIVFLVDTPGFLVGSEGERKAAPAHIMNMIHALQLCSVPKVSVILRKSFGQAYLNMGGGRNSDNVAAWPGAEASFMDAGVAVSVIHGVKQSDAPERFEELKAEFSRDTSAYALAGAFGAQTIIDPRDTRSHLIDTLDCQRRARDAGIGHHEMRAWPTYI